MYVCRNECVYSMKIDTHTCSQSVWPPNNCACTNCHRSIDLISPFLFSLQERLRQREREWKKNHYTHTCEEHGEKSAVKFPFSFIEVCKNFMLKSLNIVYSK